MGPTCFMVWLIQPTLGLVWTDIVLQALDHTDGVWASRRRMLYDDVGISHDIL